MSNSVQGTGSPDGSGSGYQIEMACFDRLPKALRAALNYGPNNYAAERCVTAMIGHGVTAQEILDEFAVADAREREIDAEDMRLQRGPFAVGRFYGTGRKR